MNHKVKEIGYAMQEPFKAIKVASYKEGRNNITTIAGNFQINAIKSASLSQFSEGDHGNAYRHALWQGLLTREFGEEEAERIGIVHEDNIQISFIRKNTVKTMKEADYWADLLNNMIGRKIGREVGNVNNVHMAIFVALEFSKNGLWLVYHNRDDTYSVLKTKITKEESYAMIKEILKKGENGLNKWSQ